MRRLVATFLLLAACRQDAPAAPAPGQPGTTAAPVPTAPLPKAFAFEEKTDLVEFEFSWSAEAAAVPELVARFTAELDKAKATITANAREEKAFRDEQKIDYHPLAATTSYATAGQSARLLSLRADHYAYTGGAHGNFGTSELIWDRARSREIKPADLFAQPANRDRLLTQRWCDALNQARKEKRGEPVAGGGMFYDCPGLNDIAFIPTDKDRDGRFDTLQLVAAPYVAGPYAEGSYEIDLPVTADIIAGIRDEYRASFAAQRVQ